MGYGMVIDLKKCIGCHGCTLSCKAANGTPPGNLRANVLKKQEGTYPTVRITSVPVLCNHCENAPCVEQCPTAAMQKDEDGIVTIDKAECIGCKTCMLACPYDALSYRENEDGYFGSVLNEYEALVYQGMPVEKVDKCDFCKGNGRLKNGEKPACVQACMAGARTFDDLDNLQGIIAQGGGYQLLPEEGTNPSVYYLPNRYY